MQTGAVLHRLFTILLFGLFPIVVLGQATRQLATPIFDAQGLGDQITLDHGWLFHPGDDAGFASPSLDDRSWKQIELGKRLARYGYPPTLQYGWLRIHVHLPYGAQGILLGLRYTSGRYQVFVNGQPVGAVGEMDRHSLYERYFLSTYPLPSAPPGPDVVVALRFSLQSFAAGGSSPETPLREGGCLLGTARSLQQDSTNQLVLNFAPEAVDALPALLTGIVALALFLSLRHSREYLWLALFAFITSAESVFTYYSYALPWTVLSINLGGLLIAASSIALIEFVRCLLGFRYSRVFLLWQLFVGLSVIFLPFAAAAGSIPSMFAPLILFANFLPYLALYVGVAAFLVRALRQGNHDARLFLPGFLCVAVLFSYDATAYTLGIYSKIILPFRKIHLGPFLFELSTLSDLVLELNILIFLILRTVRIARERNQAAAEIEAAQSVQQLLLARSSVPTPGFEVETAYRPAAEIGGDFFLVSPGSSESSENGHDDGSLIAILGDVSGKGLTAAMRVSLILGVLRGETSRVPATILSHLNQALLTQGDIGFTTACCVRLQRDGRFTLANAGQISPYIDGREIETIPGLPLGLASDQDYPESAGQLLPSQRLVLTSDGVVEARNAKGELYGFDRLGSLTRHSAHEIAATAQNFGQEDDITVLTLARAVT